MARGLVPRGRRTTATPEPTRRTRSTRASTRYPRAHRTFAPATGGNKIQSKVERRALADSRVNPSFESEDDLRLCFTYRAIARRTGEAGGQTNSD